MKCIGNTIISKFILYVVFKYVLGWGTGLVYQAGYLLSTIETKQFNNQRTRCLQMKLGSYVYLSLNCSQLHGFRSVEIFIHLSIPIS